MSYQGALERPNTLEIWWHSLRPATLLTGFAPIFVGAFCGVMQLETTLSKLPLHLWARLGIAFLVVALLQSGANLVNDVKDFEKGVDVGKRLGPMRATQMGWLTPQGVKRAYRFCFGLALFAGSLLSLWVSADLFFVGAACLLAAYCYSGGPYPLAHYGLGEVLSLVFFGFVAVAGTARLLSDHWQLDALFYGLVPGLLAASMMAVNNIRDRKGDSLAGKKTMAVFLGSKKALVLTKSFIWLSYLVLLACAFLNGPLLLAAAICAALFLLISQKVMPFLVEEPAKLNLALKKISLLNLFFGLIFFLYSL